MTLQTRTEPSGTPFSIRKGDQRESASPARDAGKSGRVLSINAKKNTVVVEHAGHHQAPHAAEPGERTSRAASSRRKPGINVSNVMVVCGSCGKHTRIGHNSAAGRQRKRAAARVAARRWISKDRVRTRRRKQ